MHSSWVALLLAHGLRKLRIGHRHIVPRDLAFHIGDALAEGRLSEEHVWGSGSPSDVIERPRESVDIMPVDLVNIPSEGAPAPCQGSEIEYVAGVPQGLLAVDVHQ